MNRPNPRSDEGSIVPLVAGFAALSLALILVVVSVTSLYLERKRLLTLADTAALAAAEAFDLDTAIGGPRLTDEAVAGAVDRHLAVAPDDFEALRVDDAQALDATSATVTLSVVWRPPVLSVFVPEGIRISVTATGRTVFY